MLILVQINVVLLGKVIIDLLVYLLLQVGTQQIGSILLGNAVLILLGGSFTVKNKGGIGAVTDLTSRFLIAEPELPVYTVKNVGKGKAVLLNIVFDAYQTLTLGGVGASMSSSSCFTKRAFASPNWWGSTWGMWTSTARLSRLPASVTSSALFPLATGWRRI